MAPSPCRLAARPARDRRRSGAPLVGDALADATRLAGRRRNASSAHGLWRPCRLRARGSDRRRGRRGCAALGLPVVLKTAEAGAHKTEQGGIALDLRDERQIRAAVERIGLPVLVQPMVGGGAELLAGIVQDPVFGPLVAFGPGGVFAELIGDAAFRIAPLTDVDAKELVHEGKAGRLVARLSRRPARTQPRSSTCCTDSRCWQRISPRSQSSISIP